MYKFEVRIKQNPSLVPECCERNFFLALPSWLEQTHHIHQCGPVALHTDSRHFFTTQGPSLAPKHWQWMRKSWLGEKRQNFDVAYLQWSSNHYFVVYWHDPFEAIADATNSTLVSFRYKLAPTEAIPHIVSNASCAYNRWANQKIKNNVKNECLWINSVIQQPNDFQFTMLQVIWWISDRSNVGK